MKFTLTIAVIATLSACVDPITWPHNEKPHVLQETNGVWVDLGPVQ